MYISHQGLTAIHEQRVRECLDRAEKRRAIEARRRTQDQEPGKVSGRRVVRRAVGAILGLAARPSVG
jgi:hypothetical protein